MSLDDAQRRGQSQHQRADRSSPRNIIGAITASCLLLAGRGEVRALHPAGPVVSPAATSPAATAAATANARVCLVAWTLQPSWPPMGGLPGEPGSAQDAV
jgi:hypothetical protein